MPEISVAEHRDFGGLEHHIWPPWQIGDVEAVTKSQSVQLATERNLAASVALLARRTGGSGCVLRGRAKAQE